MRSVTHFLRYSNLKCSKQTFTVRSVIVNSLLGGERGNWKISFSPVEDFSPFIQELKTRRHSEIKQTRPSTKQDSRPHWPHFHATRPGRRPSGSPYLHSVYYLLFFWLADSNLHTFVRFVEGVPVGNLLSFSSITNPTEHLFSVTLSSHE